MKTGVKAASVAVNIAGKSLTVAQRLSSAFNATKAGLAAGSSFASKIVQQGSKLQNATVKILNKTVAGAALVKGVSVTSRVIKPAFIAYSVYDAGQAIVDNVNTSKEQSKYVAVSGKNYAEDRSIDNQNARLRTAEFQNMNLNNELTSIFSYASAVYNEQIPENSEISDRYSARLKQIIVEHPEIRDLIPEDILQFLFS